MSFVRPQIVAKLNMPLEVLLEPYSVYIPIDESILAKKAYENYLVLALHKVFLCDLVELDMKNYNVILGMD